MPYDLLLKGGTVVLPFHGTVRCDIGVRAGKTVALQADIAVSEASEVVDARGKYVFPGAVDSHYHVGIYRPHSEDAESESRSALVGGVSTVISYWRTGLYELERIGKRYALVTMCIGGGQGIAAIFERA